MLRREVQRPRRRSWMFTNAVMRWLLRLDQRLPLALPMPVKPVEMMGAMELL